MCEVATIGIQTLSRWPPSASKHCRSRRTAARVYTFFGTPCIYVNDLYCSLNIIRVIKSKRMRWAGHVARMGERRRRVYRVLVGKPEGKRPLGRPRRRWEDNIKMEIQEVGCGGTDWIELAQDRDRWWALVNVVMNLWVP